MITPKIYDAYFTALLKGDRQACIEIVESLLDEGVEIISLYHHLFEKALYEVGALWERNQISVAKEHLVTAMTESLLNMVYPHLFKTKPTGEKAVISCAANEYHQVGGKMVADILATAGWDTYFLGANTPTEQMLAFIEETRPDMLGLSLSIYFNLPALKREIEAVNSVFPNLDIIIGGQAFKWGEVPSLNTFKNLTYIPSLEDLKTDLGES